MFYSKLTRFTGLSDITEFTDVPAEWFYPDAQKCTKTLIQEQGTRRCSHLD